MTYREALHRQQRLLHGVERKALQHLHRLIKEAVCTIILAARAFASETKARPAGRSSTSGGASAGKASASPLGAASRAPLAPGSTSPKSRLPKKVNSRGSLAPSAVLPPLLVRPPPRVASLPTIQMAVLPPTAGAVNGAAAVRTKKKVVRASSSVSGDGLVASAAQGAPSTPRVSLRGCMSYEIYVASG